MNPKEKIAKLEGLLARVKERAEAPRPNAAATFAPMQASPAQPAALAPAPEREIATPLPENEHTTIESVPPETQSGWSEPPVTAVDPSAVAAGLSEDVDSDMEVEVSSEVVEVDIDIDIDEPALMPAESGAQPVADHTPNAAELQELQELEELEEVEGELLDPSIPPAPEHHSEPAQPAANEVLEEAPSSSPRPIATVTEAYEAENAPRHTPPPESGKQVAAPSVKPSAAPPSLEGHTLVGGWREPGMALPRERESDSALRSPVVRVPPPPPPPPPEVLTPSRAAPPPAAARPQVARGASDASALVGEITRGELPDIANVAIIEGDAPSSAPATFGELLDATLAI